MDNRYEEQIENDMKFINQLKTRGVKVVVRNLKNKSFADRYDFYQSFGWGELKAAIVDDNGKFIGAQG